MSTCISKYGEYGEHEPDGEYTCQRCWVFDEAAALDELRRLRQMEAADLLPVARADVTDEGIEAAFIAAHKRGSFPVPERMSRDQHDGFVVGYRAALVSPAREPGRSEADVVTTVEELDALPVGSVVLDRIAKVFERHDRSRDFGDDRWCWALTGVTGFWSAMQVDLPATVIHRADQVTDTEGGE